jgi:MinD superfamily P-loop ATPase
LQFNTLAFIKNKPYVFEDICHSCGGCILLCPKQALSEKSRVMGRIVYGKAGETHVYTGMMNIGEASGVSIIRRLLKYKGDYKEQTVFIDCPPGSACTVIESISSADYGLIAAEPTIFGAHKPEMVYELHTGVIKCRESF